ncbi:MAG: sulfite exporter TauE/SafE family protein [Methanobacteriota archaeon]|nr:MAG: sulfite exporter TauE/SafE family protein [Euryarchaeota archaeon]
MAFELVGTDSLVIVAALVGLVGFFYSNLGLGGGQLYVPIMDLLFVSLVMKEIVPLSLCFAFVTMASATYSHSRKGLVDFKLGSFLAAGGLVGVVIGVLFTTTVDERMVKFGFAALLLVVATKMLHDMYRKEQRSNTSAKPDSSRRVAGVCVSVLTGFLVGSFGIGGGVVSVPLIIYVFRFETRKAIGTSALVGAILTPAAFAAYALREGVTIHYDLALTLTPIIFIMALVGSAWGLQKLKTKMVKTIFTGGMYLAAAEMVYSLLAS